MLQNVLNEFLDYCCLSDFFPRSRQALTARLIELQTYLKSEKLESVHVSIEKSVPQFLTQDEYSRLLGYFGENARDLPGLRNLVMVMLIGTLGLRTATLISIDICDVDIGCGLFWVVEKGRRRRSLIFPYVLCEVIQKYLDLLCRAHDTAFHIISIKAHKPANLTGHPEKSQFLVDSVQYECLKERPRRLPLISFFTYSGSIPVSSALA